MEGIENEPANIEQPLLRVKITEGAADSFEAEGAESTVMHMVTEWKARMDSLRAEATSTMDRIMGERRGQAGPGRGIEIQ